MEWTGVLEALGEPPAGVRGNRGCIELAMVERVECKSDAGQFK